MAEGEDGAAPPGGKKVDIQELGRKLDAIANRLETLEALMVSNPDYAGLVPYLRMTQASVSLYYEPLKLLSRLRLAEKRQKGLRTRDEISRCIVQALALKGPLSTSALAREVRAARGKSSRRIVRERLLKLQGEGIVRQTKEKTGTYELVE